MAHRREGREQCADQRLPHDVPGLAQLEPRVAVSRVEYFDETAVMVDTFAPLELGEAGLAAEDPAYAWTWAGRGPQAPGTDGGPAVFSNS